MRIIAGKYRGRVIHTPKGLPVRPTTDRTKESLFNILSHRLDWEDCKVLDLFSGTGNISLECWSRGAKSVVSVDQNARCVAAIRAAMSALRITGAEVIKMNAFSYVRQQQGEVFDLVFMDPPYAMARQPELVEAILNNDLLANDGLLVVEHSSQNQLAQVAGFEMTKIYGSSSISFFGKP
ncbi:MAG: 16S rRNA (guanine(966)-N(2))-methyltransferase RsmD [Bacteroidota bacterium]